MPKDRYGLGSELDTNTAIQRPPRPGETVTRPDWLITGYHQQDMYVVMGSKSLETASLEVSYELEYEDPYWRGMVLAKGIASGQYTITAVTKRTRPGMNEGEVLVMAWSAVSYGEALKQLFEVWSPGGEDPLAIGP